MHFYPFVKQIRLIYFFLFLALAACAAESETAASPPQPITPTTTMPTETAVPPTATMQTTPSTPALSTEEAVMVVFVKDGDIQIWNEAADQSETIFWGGDVIALKVSDDGQMIAFIRRSVIRQSDEEWYEESSLWVVGQNGENPRELVTAAALRQQLSAGERDSTNFSQVEWIPQTHQLIYSGTKYLVQAEGESHASPEGVYVVDTDIGSTTAPAAVAKSLRFVPSPDGRQIALISTTSLSFINIDGSNWREDVLTYPEVGVPGPILPDGVWTQDASAFVIVAPIESESPFVLNFTIWRVPLDGSPAAPLATVTEDSHPASVTFSPDGQYAAFYRWPDPAWLITPLPVDVGPLAIPHAIELGYANLHWSPTGTAFAFPDTFAGTFSQLCPDAIQDSDVCGDPVNLDDSIIAGIQWIDSDRFLFLTRDPYTLFLGRLDDILMPIVTWQPEEAASLRRFTSVLPACPSSPDCSSR